MPRYAYAGPGPHEYTDDEGRLRIVRPGDVREWDGEPSFGPWTRLPETPQEPPAVPATPSPAPAPASLGAASLTAPAPQGM